jgi:CubicO group peptidase (beta-lactamase class C family)
MPDHTSADPIQALLARAEKSASYDPRCATQVALARNGELLAFEAYGSAPIGGDGAEPRAADRDTLFAVYSVTKAITSSASWILLQEGALALGDRVVDHIPEFGDHGKDVVTVEQLLTHTAGFPTATLPDTDWFDSEKRSRHLAGWKLDWKPGSRFTYHPTSSMWVLAELITRVSGVDYQEFIRTRVFEPLGLASLFMGLPESEDHRVADVVSIGEPMSAEQAAASPVDAPVIGPDTVEWANRPENRRVGAPAGGAIATAADIALFYQGILADAEGRGAGIWRPETIRDVWTIRNEELIDPMTKQPALRGLGVVMAGESGKMWRGFAETCSPRAFGHMGAAGQVSWADPESGLSFVFLTNGAQQNAGRQGANGFRLSMLAVDCA